jgi:hypothetical protein
MRGRSLATANREPISDVLLTNTETPAGTLPFRVPRQARL